MLTKEQIENCIEEAKVYLRLTHWTTKIDWEDTASCEDEGALAMVYVTEGRYFATIAFCKGIFEMDSKEVSMIITHELLHLHSDAVYKNPRRLIGRCSGDLQDAVATVMRDDIEHMTDALAFAFANLIGEYDSFAPTEGKEEGEEVEEVREAVEKPVEETSEIKAKIIKTKGDVYWYATGH